MAGLTLDTGALIAAEKNDRRFWTYWKLALERESTLTVPAGVVAQAWRGNRPKMARIINACQVEPLEEQRAKAVGLLLADAGSSDVIDATVVLGAIARGDAIVSSDGSDMRNLAAAAGYELTVLDV